MLPLAAANAFVFRVRLHSLSTPHCPYTLQWPVHIPLKSAPSRGGLDPHLIHDSLDPQESANLTACRSVRPVFFAVTHLS